MKEKKKPGKDGCLDRLTCSALLNSFPFPLHSIPIYNNMTFYAVNNDYIIGGCYLLGLFFGLTIIRLVYLRSDKPSNYTKDVHLPVIGLNAYKLVSTLMLLVMCLLGSRVGYAYNPINQSFWDFRSINKSWWAAMRIILAAMNTLIAQVYDANPLLRFFSLITLPCLAILDTVSEVDFHFDINCVQKNICNSDSTMYYYTYLWCWRDIVSTVVVLANVVLAYWLIGLTGLTQNSLWIPRSEHRVMMQKLTKILRPKAIVRKQITQ
jgi:hypothetical protein